MADAISNLAYSLVATAPSPATSGTSLIVTAGQGALFPAAPFDLLMWPASAQPVTTNAEIARCTAVSTDTLTIVRAQYGTSARSVVIGDQCCQPIDANIFSQYLALTGGTMSGAIAMGSHKITGLTNGSAASDAAAFGQIPAAQGLGIYGDASDGVCTFLNSGSVTVAGATCASGVYTMTRDIFLASGSAINNGSTIITSGFRIFCQGTITHNGTIQYNGSAGSNGTTAGGAAGAALSPAGTIGQASVGGAGGAGTAATTGGTGSSPGGTVAFGGAGGHGGSSAANTGGAGGTTSAPNGGEGGIGAHRYLPQALMMNVWNPAGPTYIEAGGGAGGGGGSGNASQGGGGGGGGAGKVMVAAQIFAGTGSITATGGAGGNGFTFASDETGGGGGGGGGEVVVISSSVVIGSPNTISGQTITASGGAAGSSGTGSTGVTAGSAGTVILIPN